MLWNEDELRYLKECAEKADNAADAAREFIKKYPRGFHSARIKIGELKYNNPKNIKAIKGVTFEEKSQILKLKSEILGLKSDLKEAIKLAHTDQKLVEIIQEIKGKKFNKIPSWIHKKRKASLHGIPSIFASDWHFDEMVFKEQVGGLNSYNHEIATQRVNNLFNKSLDIFLNTYAKPSYDGIHLIFNGDMVSGNIHEELRETNCQPILKTVFDLSSLIIQNITNVRKEFKKVFVTWTVGNHGRLDKKPRAKNRVFDNYEWLIGQHVAKHFEDDTEVTFLIPESAECIYELYNKRFLQLHGDVFKGGNGIGGILVPILRGFAKKSQNYSAVGKPIDTMIIGHFHQYIHLNYLVINGSIKGFDEFSQHMGFPFQQPQQAAWINHPEHGMIHRTPIICDYMGEK